jgi:hypothetical protein
VGGSGGDVVGLYTISSTIPRAPLTSHGLFHNLEVRITLAKIEIRISFSNFYLFSSM